MMYRLRVRFILALFTPAACFSPGDPPPVDETPGGSATTSSTGSSAGASTDGDETATTSPDSQTSMAGIDSSDATDTTASTSDEGGSESSTSSTGGSVVCATPEELSAFPTVSQTHGVVLRGIHAYITETNRGIHALDISDPRSIAQLGDANLPNPRGVTGAGSLVYVGDPTGLISVDVSSPASPQPLMTLDLGASVIDVEASAGRVYAVTEGNGDPCSTCGLHIVDVSTPSAMTLIDEIAIGDRAMGVAIEGDVAYVAAEFDGLVSVDVSGAPAILDSATIGGPAGDVVVAAGYAYVAAGSAGMHIFDVSDPSAIVPAGSIDGEFVLGVAVEGNRAWLADNTEGLRVIDVSDPSAPVQIAAVDSFGSGSAVAVDGGIAYVTSWDGDLRVFAPPVCE